MGLLVVAVFGILVPNALFVYWLLNDFTTVSAALSDRLALAFTLDVFASMFVLAYLFARKPLGPYRWPWFVGLCLVGTLCFGIPMYLWLNWRAVPEPRPSVTEWWRAIR